jgi:hypothetical protein
MKRIIIPLFLIFFCIPSLYAIGIRSESNQPITLQPGFSKDYKFYVSDITEDVEIYAHNDIENTMDVAQYVKLSNPVDLDTGEKFFIATVSFPQNIDDSVGGRQAILIGAKEKSSTGTIIGGVAAVQKVIFVNVLYPEKRIRIGLSVPNINENEEIKATVSLQSWSIQDISKISGLFMLFNENDEKIAEKESSVISLKSGATDKITENLPTVGLSAGNYRIEAVITYDGEEVGEKREFRIGSMDLTIDSYTEEIPAGGISKFKIAVRSGWNSHISGVYATVFLNGKEVLKTPNYELEPWGSVTLENYLDASSLDVGKYPIEIVLHFGGATKRISGTLKAVEKEKESSEESPSGNSSLVVIVLVAGLVVMIFVNIFWMLKKKR